MSIYVDTSGFLAALDTRDDNHAAARSLWTELLQNSSVLLCSSYVVVETFALVQARLGVAAVRVLQEDLMPFVSVHWVDQAAHSAGVSAVLTANRRSLSLTDCVSFIVMRQLGVHEVFAFDRHFAEQGFVVRP